jgi:hypothetical protein
VENTEKTVSGNRQREGAYGEVIEDHSTELHRERAGEKSPARYSSRMWLLIGFLGTVFLSLSSIMLLGRLFGGAQAPVSVVVETPVDDSMPDALVVKGPGRVVKIPDIVGLNPASGGDFLFFIWFKLSKPLNHDEKAVFVGKYDPNSKVRPGYSFALSGASDGVRPLVYWQDEAGAGRWYAFSATQIRPEQWYMLSVSWRKERFLGVHLTRLGESKPELLGGYDLGEVRSPQSPADLVIGAFGSSVFRGKIGTVGVIRQKDISEKLLDTIRLIAKSPREIPLEIPQDAIQLWATPKTDKGPHHIEIRSGTNQRRSAKQ